MQQCHEWPIGHESSLSIDRIIKTRWSCPWNSDQKCTQNSARGGRDPGDGWVGVVGVYGVVGSRGGGGPGVGRGGGGPGCGWVGMVGV